MDVILNLEVHYGSSNITVLTNDPEDADSKFWCQCAVCFYKDLVDIPAIVFFCIIHGQVIFFPLALFYFGKIIPDIVSFACGNRRYVKWVFL